jgi:hypothetical protein
MAQEYLDVSGFELFSDGPAREDYLQAWVNDGDDVQVSFVARGRSSDFETRIRRVNIFFWLQY